MYNFSFFKSRKNDIARDWSSIKNHETKLTLKTYYHGINEMNFFSDLFGSFFLLANYDQL